MSGLLLLAALLPILATDPPISEDIVVTAIRDTCQVRLADRDLSDAEFDRRARIWAGGTPVRVIARADADVQCLSKIAFRLADKGVTRIVFIDPNGRPATPLVPRERTAPSGGGTSTLRDRERSFLAGRAARLILEGKCAEARQITLQAGDLASAAQVTEICRQ